jgi:hypothetical protein
MLLIAISSSSFIFIIVEKVKNTSVLHVQAGWTWRLDFFIFLVLWQWEILRH